MILARVYLVLQRSLDSPTASLVVETLHLLPPGHISELDPPPALRADSWLPALRAVPAEISLSVPVPVAASSPTLFEKAAPVERSRSKVIAPSWFRTCLRRPFESRKLDTDTEEGARAWTIFSCTSSRTKISMMAVKRCPAGAMALCRRSSCKFVKSRAHPDLSI